MIQPTIENAENTLTVNSNWQRPELRDHFASLAQQLRGSGAIGATQSMSLGLTSCLRGEGVTTMAVNLAATVASGNRQVLIVDAHLTHPQLAALFRVGAVPGLPQYLAGESLGNCIRATDQAGLFVLPSSAVGSVELETFPERLLELKADYDMVVVDLPPVGDGNRCLSLAAALDGVLLVVEAERVEREVLGRSKQRLQRAGVSVVGAVFNKWREVGL